MPILVKPVAQIDLDHLVSHFGGFSSHTGLAVATDEGCVTIISPDLKKCVTFKRLEKLQSISIHPTKPLLAIVEGRDCRLSVVDLEGLPIHIAQSDGMDEEWPPRYYNPHGACYFTSDGRYLWYVVAWPDENKIEIRLLESDSWQIVDNISIKGAYGESYPSIYATGLPERIALWMSEGESHRQVYWLTINDGLIDCDIETLLVNTSPPFFSPSGEEFLISEDATALRKYQLPGLQLVGNYHWPEDGEQKDGFGFSLSYIDQERALACSLNNRLFLFDLTQMAVLHEVWIKGHKPQHIYNRICTDIRHFERFGDTLIFVFRREWGFDQTWKDTLLFLPVTTLLA